MHSCILCPLTRSVHTHCSSLCQTLCPSTLGHMGDLETDSEVTDSHTRGGAVAVQEANCSNESGSNGQKDQRGRGLELRQEELRKPFWAWGPPTRAQQAEEQQEQGCSRRYEKAGGCGEPPPAEFISTEVGAQGVGLGDSVKGGRSGRRGGAGELGGQALNVR